ncbi:hypothetical protein M885DRAFT_514330 [Pelagophyceae sp. CCMP2097]|nr:hypothetical protein M885DRAFT_514330 [Pelagophyceae sp. CCMP2097]|mmetsp:Transcript_2058/g.6259  ORF Transcript_2058/g.6259 Transcript_2058/m.6259 type:complete len:300 (-) Transcript_2058:23-922(-)
MLVLCSLLLTAGAAGALQPGATCRARASATALAAAPAALPAPAQTVPLRAVALEETLRGVSAVGGCLATWALVAHGAAPPIFASSAVGLVSGLAFPAPFAAAAFCGSFAGMGSGLTLEGAATLAVWNAALLAVCERRGWLKGKGGRLGCISAVATLTRRLALREALLSVPSATGPGAATLLTALGGAGLCCALQPTLSPVSAASAVGLLGDGPAYLGAFAGMSAKGVLANGREVAAAAAAAATLLLLERGRLAGVGGRLGLAAVLGVIMYDSLIRPGLLRALRLIAAAALARAPKRKAT